MAPEDRHQSGFFHLQSKKSQEFCKHPLTGTVRFHIPWSTDPQAQEPSKMRCTCFYSAGSRQQTCTFPKLLSQHHLVTWILLAAQALLPPKLSNHVLDSSLHTKTTIAKNTKAKLSCVTKQSATQAKTCKRQRHLCYRIFHYMKHAGTKPVKAWLLKVACQERKHITN